MGSIDTSAHVHHETSPQTDGPASPVTLSSLAGPSLCWALYRRGALRAQLSEMRCEWEAIYVYREWGPDPVGVICARCGEVRAVQV